MDDLNAFLEILPERVREHLKARGSVDDLVEVVMDLGRVPEARFPGEQAQLGDEEITHADIAGVIEKLGEFGDDNRAGIERTLHRFSAVRNRAGQPVGLTCRVGRAVFGSVKLIDDLVKSDDSILLLGRPGVGKTTILREVARVLADDLGKRVVIVDTSNEIAGDGDVPHPAIGRARRLQVPRSELQHKVMIEAVENHMPEVIIIDEMSTELEALAARTIAERGVQLVATAHGNTLENLVSNPSLSDLVGGTQTVTLGDMEARRRGTQKTVLERKHEPTFEVVVEIRERNNVAVNRDVGTAVDLALRGYPTALEVRWMEQDGSVHTMLEEPDSEAPEMRPPPFEISDNRRSRSGRSARYSPRAPDRRAEGPRKATPPQRSEVQGNGATVRATPTGPAMDAPEVAPEPLAPPVKVYPFGIPRATIQEAIELATANAALTEDAIGADFFLTTKSHYNRRPTEVRESEKRGVPVYVLRRGTSEQVLEFLRRFGPRSGSDTVPRAARRPGAGIRGAADGDDDRGNGTQPRDVREAIVETEDAIQRVLAGERKVALAPQLSFIRRLQHGLASKYNLGSSSMGNDPGRRVVIRKRRR